MTKKRVLKGRHINHGAVRRPDFLTERDNAYMDGSLASTRHWVVDTEVVLWNRRHIACAHCGVLLVHGSITTLRISEYDVYIKNKDTKRDAAEPFYYQCTVCHHYNQIWKAVDKAGVDMYTSCGMVLVDSDVYMQHVRERIQQAKMMLHAAYYERQQYVREYYKHHTT